MLIAQITDVHVTRSETLLAGRVDTRAAFKACIARLENQLPPPDLLVISGDLTETATDEEYDFIVSGLTELDMPYLVVPGNHDDRAAMRRAFPDMALGESDAPFCFVAERPTWPLRLIGLDSTIPRRSEGALCFERLKWLEQELRRSSPEHPALIFMHHPPFQTGIAPMDACGLKDGTKEFQDLITAQAPNIAGVLCGHVHRIIHAAIGGVPILLAPSSAHQITLDLQEEASLTFSLEPPKIALHDWRPETGLVSHYAYVDDFPGPYPF